jgi:hypothetical protein
VATAAAVVVEALMEVSALAAAATPAIPVGTVAVDTAAAVAADTARAAAATATTTAAA